MPFLVLPHCLLLAQFNWKSKGWKNIEQKMGRRKVFEKLSTPDFAITFSSFNEWKVHLNSIFLVNALLIHHLNFFIPLSFNPFEAEAIEKHKNVIKLNWFSNMFHTEIVFHLVKWNRSKISLMPLDAQFFPWKVARSGKSWIWTFQWQSPSFDFFSISIISRFSFVSILEIRKRCMWMTSRMILWFFMKIKLRNFW